MLKLDFSIETSDDRAAYVNKYMDQVGTKYTQKELETIANYILYGKDKDGTSIVDRKEVQIKTKYGSYQRKEPESLEALMESPTFDEREFCSGPTRYKKGKPKIDRKKDWDVPGIQELWKIIDGVQKNIDEEKEKVSPDNRLLYQLSHYVIELRKQQFVLKDMVKPTICRTRTNVRDSYYEVDAAVPWDLGGTEYSIAPLGVIDGYRERFTNPRSLCEKDYHYEDSKYTLDFRNPLHIYYLLENYCELEEEGMKDPESIMMGILRTLDFYLEDAALSDEHLRILDLKRKKLPNETIRIILNEEFGVSHSANYISTMYKQKICSKIAGAAALNYDRYYYREDDHMWKICSCCGEEKLRDLREFMKRSRSPDGFASTCKDCCKKKRMEGN